MQCNFVHKNWMCTGKNNKQKSKDTQRQQLTLFKFPKQVKLSAVGFLQSEMSLKYINKYPFYVRGIFLNCQLKVKMAEDLIHSGIEDHSFGPTNVRKHFPEDDLTLSRSRLLEVDSFVG